MTEKRQIASARKRPTDPTAPWMPAKWELPDAAAIQALLRGEATPDQQARAMKFVVESLCGTFDQPYMPDSQRDTDFALGKRWVGLQLVKLSKLNLSTFKEKNR